MFELNIRLRLLFEWMKKIIFESNELGMGNLPIFLLPFFRTLHNNKLQATRVHKKFQFIQ